MECDYVVVIIFVNRIEFASQEAFDEYPRSESADIEVLRSLRYVDILFLPKEEEFYHNGTIRGALISYHGGLGEIYEMERRPEKFTGMSTIITKLAGIIQPTQIYVGRNCVQTERLLRLLLEDLLIPVEVVGVPALRGPDGILFKATATLMVPESYELAKLVFPALMALISRYLHGESQCNQLLRDLRNDLERPSLLIDYLAIVNEENFDKIEVLDFEKGGLLIIGVCINGKFQLVDNVVLAPCKPKNPNWFSNLFKKIQK